MLKELIKQKRLMKGLRQEDLATLIGVSRQTIAFIEGGKDCKLKTLRKLGEVLDIPELKSL